MVNFFEKKNNAETTLSQGINSSITTIKVADASSFPTSGNFIVTIWNKTSYPDPSDDSSMEIVKVTNVSGNTFTVVRGQESTSAHSHSSGHAVELLITVGQITEIEGAINNHLSDTNNPHEVSKSDVGLSNVPNLDTTDAVANEHTHSNKSELDLITDGDHDVRTDNPHLVTKTQVGLSNVPNLDTTDAINKAHDQNSDTALDEGNPNEVTAVDLRSHLDETNNPHQVTAAQVGTYTQDEIEALFGGTNFDYFLTDNAEGVIADYNNLVDEADVGVEATITASSVSADDTLIQSFITASNQPDFTVLLAGIYHCHLHANVSQVLGFNTIVLYWELYKRDTDDNETLLITSEESDVLTTVELQYAIHGLLTEDETLLTTDRLVLKVYANVDTPSGGNPDVNIHVEGDTASRIEVITTINTFDNRFMKVRSNATEDDLVAFDSEGDSKDSGLLTSDVSDAVSKKHTQNSDTILDENGDNEVSASEIRDFLDNNVPHGLVLDVPFDGTDGATSATDNTGGHAVSFLGDAEIDTSQFFEGDSSVYFAGNEDKLEIAGDEDFWFGTGDFTIKFKIRFESISALQALLSAVGASFWQILYYGDGTDTLTLATSNFNLTFDWTASIDTWYDFVLLRDGSNFKLFIDKSQQDDTVVQAGTMPALSTPYTVDVGWDDTAGREFNGWIDRLQILKGYAIYPNDNSDEIAGIDVDGNVYRTDYQISLLLKAQSAYTHSILTSGNPHNVTKNDVGLGNVDNKSEATIITDVKADADVADAISKKHTQGTDQGLDTGGANAVTAAQAKTAYTHSQGDGSDHADVAANTALAHTQNSDTILDEGGANETSAAEIRGHIDDTNNPHGVDKTDVGLGNVDNVQQMPLSYLDTDDTLSADSDEKVSSQKAIKAYVDNVSGSSDTLKNLLLNIALLAFKLAVQSSLTIFKMIDGFMDEYEDASGIDAASSTNESYNSSDDYYSPSSALDSNSKLALNLDGSDGATSTTDESPSAHSVTFNGTAQLDTAEKKYGTASLLLDGNSDYLTLSDSSDWDICAVTTETWTVHCFIKTSGASGYIFSHTNGSDLWGLRLSSSKLTFFATSGGPDVINAQGTSNIADNVWHHVALVKIGGATPHWALYVDGTQEAYVEDTSTTNYTGTLYIGQSGFSSSYWSGWLDVIHIYKGNYFGANPNVGLSDTITPPSGVLGGVNNMTLISEAVVSDITPDTARIVIFEEDVDSVTLNTDLLAYISRDDGANYTQITLSAEETYSGSARVLSGVADISGQPSDTDVVYKIVTANNKNCRIHGTGIFWS